MEKTKNQHRIEEMKRRLTDALKPKTLIITDDSHHHIGHEGAKSGQGHFSVTITASVFKNKSVVEKHRMVYDALGDLMKTDIHALRITAKPLQ